MAVLEWHKNTSGRYISGVSHGVFYGDDGVPIPWNGLINVTEKFQTNEPTPVYNSLGQKYDLHGNVAEKRHSLVCYTYPEEMDEYLGTEYVDEFGFAVDERPPRKFNMVYRSECDGYYELHILLDQIATFGDKTHATDTSAPGISNITMNLQGVPHEVFGSSHLILDSRNPITASAERILFGTHNEDGCFNKFLDAEVEWIPQAINYAPTIEPDYDNPVLINSVEYPGIKDASKWNTTNVVPYWDEVTEQLALHSESTEEWTQSKLSIPLDVSIPIDLKTSADINFGGMVDEEVGENLLTGTGGDNLSVGTSFNPSIVEEDGKKAVAFNPDGNIISLVQTGFELKEGDEVSFSFKAKASKPLSLGRVYLGPGNDNSDFLRDQMVTTEWAEYSFSYTVSTPAQVHVHMYPHLDNGDGTYETFYITEWKLEYGSVATPWTPAPEDALHRRIIGTREPQVLSEQAPNIIGSQTVTLNSTVHDNPQVDIYHNGPVGSDDVRVDNLIVTLQNYHGEFFDGNTVPKTRGERYRRVESTAGYYTVYEHLRFRTQSEIELHTIGSELYELTAPETHLSIDGDQFTFIGPQATSTGDDTFEIDDTILGF